MFPQRLSRKTPFRHHRAKPATRLGFPRNDRLAQCRASLHHALLYSALAATEERSSGVLAIASTVLVLASGSGRARRALLQL